MVERFLWLCVVILGLWLVLSTSLQHRVASALNNIIGGRNLICLVGLVGEANCVNERWVDAFDGVVALVKNRSFLFQGMGVGVLRINLG